MFELVINQERIEHGDVFGVNNYPKLNDLFSNINVALCDFITADDFKCSVKFVADGEIGGEDDRFEIDSMGIMVKQLLVLHILISLSAKNGYETKAVTETVKKIVLSSGVDNVRFLSKFLSDDNKEIQFSAFYGNHDITNTVSATETICSFVKDNFDRIAKDFDLVTQILTHTEAIENGTFTEADVEWVDESSDYDAGSSDDDDTPEEDNLVDLMGAFRRMKECMKASVAFSGDVDSRLERAIDEDATTPATQQQCIICLTNLSKVVNIPCGHLCVCIGCTKDMKARPDNKWRECALCRAPVVSMVPVVF